MFTAYVVGTFVLVFAGLALLQDGPLGDSDLPRHPLGPRGPRQLGSWALVLRKKGGAAAAGRLVFKRRGPAGFGGIRPVKRASCLALANSHAAYKPPTNPYEREARR